MPFTHTPQPGLRHGLAPEAEGVRPGRSAPVGKSCWLTGNMAETLNPTRRRRKPKPEARRAGHSSAQPSGLGIRRPTNPCPVGTRYSALSGRRNSWGTRFPRRCLGLRDVAPLALGAGIARIRSAGVLAGGFGRRLAARTNTGPGGPVNPQPGRPRYGKQWSKRDSWPLFGSSKLARSAGEALSEAPGGRRLRSLGACISLPQPSPEAGK